MPSCSRVHDWIDEKGFESKADVIAYVSGPHFVHRGEGGMQLSRSESNDIRWDRSNGNLHSPIWGDFWVCVDLFDFETEFIIDKRGRLIRRFKETKRFTFLGLDPSTRSVIREFLREGR